MPALLNLQPGGALLLGGLVLLVAGLVLLWLTRAHMPSDVIQLPSTPPPTPLMLTLTPILVTDPIVIDAPFAVFETPRCYDTPSDPLLCLGLLRNSSDQLWKNISLEAYLAPESQRVVLEQTYLLPGDTAPYRVVWPSANVQEEEAVVSIKNPQAQSVTDTVIEISVQGFEGQWLTQTRYQTRGTLQNPTDQTLNLGQMIVTLLDKDAAVVGYRLSDMPLLMPHASVPFQVDLTPVLYDEHLTPSITVLAWTH